MNKILQVNENTCGAFLLVILSDFKSALIPHKVSFWQFAAFKLLTILLKEFPEKRVADILDIIRNGDLSVVLKHNREFQGPFGRSEITFLLTVQLTLNDQLTDFLEQNKHRKQLVNDTVLAAAEVFED